METESTTKTKTSPIVSIGMPVYNGGKTITEALDSLLAQDFNNFELIISDNASTDQTAKICQQYAAHDSRIKYYRNETNIGPTANFNRLIHLAGGKYFMWAADDDLWEPSYLSNMVDALDNNPGAVLSFCSFDDLDMNKQLLRHRDTWSGIVRRGRFYRLLRSCFLIPWEENRACYFYGLIRKDVLLTCGGLETRVDAYKGADIVTLFHLLYYGQFVKVDKLLYHKRNISDRTFLKEPLAIRLEKQSLYSLVISYLKWLIMWHQHYYILRVIVKKTSLYAYQKITLINALYLAEFLFYLNNLRQTLICTLYDYLQIFKAKVKRCLLSSSI